MMSSMLALAITPAGCAVETDEETEDENIPDDANGEPTGTGVDALTRSDFDKPNLDGEQRAAVLAKYTHVDPNKVIDRTKRETALLYYDVNKSKLQNDDVLVVVDFAKPSRDKRFFVIDVKSGSVQGHVVAHGSGSDPNNDGMLDKFSNVKNSNASSLGFYLTAETYNGKYGRSLRMDGLSDTNSNVRVRDVVVHGADYVKEGRSKQGRSWGCFALPMSAKDGIISKIAGGALIYASK
jgi:hypothetical protein